MAAKKPVPLTPRSIIEGRAVAYVFGNADGSNLSDEGTLQETVEFAEEWLVEASMRSMEKVTEQTVFALVPVRVVRMNGVTITDVTEA